MVCWMQYIKDIKQLLSQYNLSDEQAAVILKDIERDVGHNANLIKATVDTEKEDLIKRLRKKKTEKEESKSMSYA